MSSREQFHDEYKRILVSMIFVSPSTKTKSLPLLIGDPDTLVNECQTLIQETKYISKSFKHNLRPILYELLIGCSIYSLLRDIPA